jgi:hypothetical protein
MSPPVADCQVSQHVSRAESCCLSATSGCFDELPQLRLRQPLDGVAVLDEPVDQFTVGAGLSLRPAFDAAAPRLAECAEVVNSNTDPETFLASASADGIKTWQAIDEHVGTLTIIGSVVAHFGPHSASFPLSEVPGNVSNAGFINNIDVLCVSPEWHFERACALFHQFGSHRNSPWFRGASSCG